MIELSARTPLKVGKERAVYVHPDDPTLLIKIGRTEFINRSMRRVPNKKRYRELASYVGELMDQFAVRTQTPDHPRHLQKIVGFADTDLGLGLIVEAALDVNGEYAPTLREIVASGRFDKRVRADLEMFLFWIVNTDIVLNDVNGRNIVYAYHKDHGCYFVLIDGYGGVPKPVYFLFPWLQRASKRRKTLRLLKGYPLAAGCTP